MGPRIRAVVILIFLFAFLTFNILISYGAYDAITTTQVVTADQTLISSGSIFELGFFRTEGNSLNYYIGIWYTSYSYEIEIENIVWVANRDTPVDKFSSQLQILDGNLVLVNGSNSLIWSTNITNPSSSNSVMAVLGDDGNLVLVDQSASNGLDSKPIWESFNHPTHTLLPGAKLRYNKLTKKNQMLTSWKNSGDPGTGVFSLEINPDGRQYTIRSNGSVSSSGALNGEIFSLIPGIRLNHTYNFSYIDNKNETYFTYTLYDTSLTSRWVIDISGQMKMFTWSQDIRMWNLFWSQPTKTCEIYASCGAFGICDDNSNPHCNCLTGFMPNPGFANDSSLGCARRTDLECVIGKKDGFFTISQMEFPEPSQYVDVESLEECEGNCLNNCSCTAYAYNGNGYCSIWNGILTNLRQLHPDGTNGNVIHIKVSSSELSRSRNRMFIIVLGCVSGMLGLLGLVWFSIMRSKKKINGSTRLVYGSLVVFRYKDLKKATKSFSEKLGSGGFGSVFKGTLYEDSSTIVAVKRLEGISQGEKQFRAEVSTIGKIQHVNLLRLYGFCSDTNKRLLVYEYMPNGSLNSHLFNAEDSKILDWKRRYQIALGIAKGLSYLHEKCRDCIIHCDIKPENILLDAEFCPKVADFGLAKIFGHEFSKVLTSIRGTRGYLAPEWISGVAITTKADVYSYGMMLFELVSGRRNTELSLDSEIVFFPTEAATVTTREGDILNLLDRRLGGTADVEEVRRICRVACWCVQDDENLRPSMGQVVQILEGVLEVKLPHMPLSLQLLAYEKEEHINFFSDQLSSLNSQAQVLPLNICIEH